MGSCYNDPMAFYIVSKGRLTQYSFSYLDNELPVRLEPTQIHGQKKRTAPDAHSRDYYAYELMSKNVQTLSPANFIAEARQLMHEKKFHHLPLVVDHKLTGMISYQDLVNLKDGENLERVAHHMSRLVLCASDTTPLRHVVDVFFHENINALPLIDDDFRLVGIITHRDILKWLVENKKLLKEYNDG